MAMTGLTCGWVLGLGACFDPMIVSGVPCDPAAPSCPRGQACIRQSDVFVCASAGAIEPDAPAPVTDGDGDGILDVDDNCPSFANPDQGNYDGDRFGDACDPCPPIMNDAPIDGDDDGVSDDCDPDPALAGDRIASFEPFRADLARWEVAGPWTIGADGVDIDLGTGDHGSLTMPITAGVRTTVHTAFTIHALRTFADHAAMGGIAGADPDQSLHCAVMRKSTGAEYVGIIDTRNGDVLDSARIDLELGRRYTSSLTVSSDTARCRAADLEVAATDPTARVEVGVHARGARGTVHWVLVLEAP
jgi:hypothetical protein